VPGDDERVGGVGGHLGVRYATAPVAERHGSAGARSVGGVGGHVGAPHCVNT
jgi:hypothetical protein